MEKSLVEDLPNITEVSEAIERLLQNIFRDNYSKYVIKHNNKRFLILPPRYLHFPPILITIQEHPENSNKALFLTISRRVPIDSQENIRDFLSKLSTMMHVTIESITRPKNMQSNIKTMQIHYLLLSTRIHSLAIKDKTWLLLAFSSMIRLDEELMSESEDEKQEESKKPFPPIEYT